MNTAADMATADDWDNAPVERTPRDRNHPRVGEMPEREAIAFLIWTTNSDTDSFENGKADFLDLADAILETQRTHYRR